MLLCLIEKGLLNDVNKEIFFENTISGSNQQTSGNPDMICELQDFIFWLTSFLSVCSGSPS